MAFLKRSQHHYFCRIHRHQRWAAWVVGIVYSLLSLVLPPSFAQEEHDYYGTSLHRLRSQAFSGVPLHFALSHPHPPQDPHYSENQLAIRQGQWLLNKREILSVQPDGRYLVTYAQSSLTVAYSPSGQTEAFGPWTESQFPQKITLYQYPTGQLKTITLSLSPKDTFIFDADGALIHGNTESTLWERPSIQKKVSSIGQKLLAANHIKERISFSVSPDSETANAYSTEENNQVTVTKGLLAYLDSDDELAGVLGHEISHIIMRHRNIYPHPSNDEILQQILQRHYGITAERRQDSYEFEQSQEKELSADRMGLRLMVRAGYQPEAMLHIYEKIMSDGSQGRLSTHPSGSQRLQALRRQINSMATNSVAAAPTTPNPTPAPPVNALMALSEPDSNPLAPITLQGWTWQTAQAEIWKQQASWRSTSSDHASPLGAWPKQDPEYDKHQQALRTQHSLPGQHFVQQEAIGIYAQLLANTQQGKTQYSVLPIHSTQYPTYTQTGQLSQMTQCNQASYPRVCQTHAAESGALHLVRFEISEQHAFVFDREGQPFAYQLQGQLFQANGKQPMAVIHYLAADRARLDSKSAQKTKTHSSRATGHHSQ